MQNLKKFKLTNANLKRYKLACAILKRCKFINPNRKEKDEDLNEKYKNIQNETGKCKKRDKFLNLKERKFINVNKRYLRNKTEHKIFNLKTL